MYAALQRVDKKTLFLPAEKQVVFKSHRHETILEPVREHLGSLFLGECFGELRFFGFVTQ